VPSARFPLQPGDRQGHRAACCHPGQGLPGDVGRRRGLRRGPRLMAINTFDVTTIRKDFPIFETGIAYLDSANTSQRPRPVAGAMMEYFEKFNSKLDRAAYHI